MKLAYVANVRMPTEKAHGVQIMQVCWAFAQNGHEVTLVVPARRNAISKSAWEFFDLEPSFKIVYIPIVDFIVWDKWLGNFALWLETLWFGLSARRAIASLNPDVVYSRDAFSLAVVPSRFRRVFEAHDFPRRFIWLYRRLWSGCDRIVALTAGLRDRFASFGIPNERLVVAHDAVDPERFNCPQTQAEARKALGLPSGFLAVYVGALYPQKGALDLLEAARHVDSNVKIAIVGGAGELLEKFRARVAELKLTNVFLPGAVPHTEVTLWLRAADVAVLPNRGGSDYAERYTSPMKLFEYLAAGRAIVTSDLPTVREVLKLDEAVFVSPGNPKLLAEKINSLARNPAEVIRLEAVSKQLAPLHTWQTRAKVVLADLSVTPSAKSESFWCRYRVEISLALLALLVRVIYVIWWPQVSISGGDGPYYLRLADVIRGVVPTPTDQPLFFVSVYPYLLAAIKSLFGDNLLWIRLAQAALSASTVLVAALMARRWIGRQGAWVVGFVGAFYVPMIIESGIIYTETIYTLFLTLTVFLFLRMLESRKFSAALLAGVGFVLVGATREVGFYLAYILAFFVAIRKNSLKLAVVFAIPLTLFIVSLSWHNQNIAKNFPGVEAPVVSKKYHEDLASVSRQKFFWSHVYLVPEGVVRFFQFPYHLSNVGAGLPTKSMVVSGDWPGLRVILPEIFAKSFLVVFHWLILALAAIGLVRGRVERTVKLTLGLIIGLMALMTVAVSMNSYDPIAGYGSMARFRFTVEPLILILAAAGVDYWNSRPARK